jgi:hypothetical protein
VHARTLTGPQQWSLPPQQSALQPWQVPWHTPGCPAEAARAGARAGAGRQGGLVKAAATGHAACPGPISHPCLCRDPTTPSSVSSSSVSSSGCRQQRVQTAAAPHPDVLCPHALVKGEGLVEALHQRVGLAGEPPAPQLLLLAARGRRSCLRRCRSLHTAGQAGTYVGAVFVSLCVPSDKTNPFPGNESAVWQWRQGQAAPPPLAHHGNHLPPAWDSSLRHGKCIVVRECRRPVCTVSCIRKATSIRAYPSHDMAPPGSLLLR